jgi:hypothetical protein
MIEKSKRIALVLSLLSLSLVSESAHASAVYLVWSESTAGGTTGYDYIQPTKSGTLTLDVLLYADALGVSGIEASVEYFGAGVAAISPLVGNIECPQPPNVTHGFCLPTGGTGSSLSALAPGAIFSPGLVSQIDVFSLTDAAYDAADMVIARITFAYTEGSATFDPLTTGGTNFVVSGPASGSEDISFDTQFESAGASILEFAPERNVFILRDTVGDSRVDGYDVEIGFPEPEIFTLSQGALAFPRGIANGPEGRLVVIGKGGGFARIDVSSGNVFTKILSDLTGDNVALAADPGQMDLFVARDTTGSTYVDRLDRNALVFTENIEISAGLLASPVGIAYGDDGMLYVVGMTTGFVRVDPLTSVVTYLGLSPPTGQYVSLTRRSGSGKLYLLRDTSSDTKIDVYDIDAGIATYDFASFAAPSLPIAITDCAGDLLCAVGVGDGLPAIYTSVDADSGSVVQTNVGLDFAGTNVAISNFFVPEPGFIVLIAAGIVGLRVASVSRMQRTIG